MTGNIVGEEFENYVFDQIGYRQSAQGSGLNSNRSPEVLQYLNNNNAFIKLASSVSVEDGYGVERLGKIVGNSDAEKYRGYNLAKNSILFNGLSSLYNKGEYNFREGVTKTKKTGGNLWDSTSAYGLGGSNFGLQPMPGIIGANVRTLNRGSIRKAQITIKCFNRFQFEVIELLYLRLGFTMMLEWGNNKYLTSENTIEKTGNTLIEEVWFGDTSYSQLEMLNEIEKKREQYLGNYDGFFGRVSNFTWSFEEDGSYSITIDLITLGDIIESLQANNPVQSYNSKEIKENKESLTKKDALLGDLKDSPIITSAENDIISAWLFNSISKPELWDLNGEYPNYFNLSNSVEKELGTNNSKKIPAKYRYFITFQELLNEVNNKLIPEIDNGGETKSPILGIYSEVINNYVNYYPNQFSTDPRICLIKPNFGNANIKDFKYPSYLEPLKNYVGIESPAIYGQLMNLYLNFDFISKCITTSTITSDNTTKVSLYTFLEKICNGINNALGGVNKIEPIINEDYYITFIDQNPIPGLVNDKPKESIVDLEVYGYNKEQNTSNFVKSIDFQTKITPDLATQITIGATSAGSAVKNEDATAFSKWSQGLVDRFNKKYIESNSINSNDLPKSEIWRKEALEIFPTYPEVIIRTKVTKRIDGETIYRGSEIKQNKSSLKRTIDLFGKKEKLTEQQFLIRYQERKTTLEKEGIIDQSEFDKIFTTNWSFYISECFAGNVSYEVDLGKRVVNSNPKNPNAINQAVGLGGIDVSKINEKEITSKTTKIINSNTHRYIQFDPNFISRANNVYRNYLVSWYKNLYNTSNNPSPSSLPGFIPLTFNITLQGISGVKIYNKLNINQQFLPKQYPEALKFLITGIDHIIENNNWETNLGTLSIPNTRPEVLEELIKNVDPNVSDYGVGVAQPDNSKEFVIQANIQIITTPIDNVRDVSQGIRLQKVNVFQREREDYKIVTIDETLELFNPTARTPFRGFFEELARDYKGYTLYVNDVFRTFKESQDIYDTQIKELAEGIPTFEPAPPGTSDHNFGLAIDFNIKTPQNTFLTSLDPSGWRKHAIDKVASNNGIEWGIAKDYVHFWYKG